MKLLRIKDNSQQKKESFSQVAKLTGKIANKTLEQLEREGVFVFPETVKGAEDITQDQMILQSVNDAYPSGNVMGFLGYGDERLVIESRFCGEGEDFFFQYLLDKVLDFPNIVDLDSDANQDNRLFNFCCSCFRITSSRRCGRACSRSISVIGIMTEMQKAPLMSQGI